jgi:DNA polymerase-3 subunit delta'
LARSIETRKLGHAYLFVGPGQVGKRTLAKAFAQAILCTGADVPCGTCRSCQLVHRERHSDVHVIDPEGDRIKIETIRTMQRSVPLSPVEGRYRICVISQFDTATSSAANALLKTLEEPPPTVVMLLTASRVASVLPTIVSRCQVVPLRVLPTQQVTSALLARGVEDEQAHLLGRLAQGRIGWAISAAQDGHVLQQREQTLEHVSDLAQASYTERFAWASAVSKKPEDVPQVLRTLTSWWRDILLIASASSTPIANVDREATLLEWASRCDVQTAKQALRAIRDAAWQIEHNANLRLALEVLMLDLPSGV